MKKSFATAAFTAFFSAAASLHGAFAQTHEAEMTSQEISAKVAEQTLNLSVALDGKIEMMDAPFAEKLAALDNAQPGRARMAQNTRPERETIVLAMAN